MCKEVPEAHGKGPITYGTQCCWDFILEDKREAARLCFVEILAWGSLLTLTTLPGHTVISRR